MLTKRKQVYLAVAGSVGLHLIVLFAWALTVQWFPDAQAASKETPEEIKLQVVDEKPDIPPPPEPEPAAKTPAPKQLAFKDTANQPEASQAPKDAVFQSDRNSEAASELPASGDKPLPTQRGKKVPYFAFDSRPAPPGGVEPVSGQKISENMPPPLPETAPPAPRPVATPKAQPTPPPAPTATPAESTVDPRDLAMVTPKSLPLNPADAEPNPYDPSFRAPAGITEPPRPTPVPRRGGYRPMQERTDAAGSIGKSGPNAVSSAASPAGRYIASVERAVDLHYHQYVDARADVVSLGTVRIHIIVDRDGKVRSPRVVSNSANEALVAVSLHALSDAKIPPMPPEVVASFEGGELQMEINFGLE